MLFVACKKVHRLAQLVSCKKKCRAERSCLLRNGAWDEDVSLRVHMTYTRQFGGYWVECSACWKPYCFIDVLGFLLDPLMCFIVQQVQQVGFLKIFHVNSHHAVMAWNKKVNVHKTVETTVGKNSLISHQLTTDPVDVCFFKILRKSIRYG